MTGEHKRFFSEKEKELIKTLQQDLPLCPEPYRQIADCLGLKEEEVLETIGRWKDEGVIRRFGATVRHHEVGYQANCMVVWKLEDHSLHQETGKILSSFPQVSHCYCRPAFDCWPYTIYTMVHGGSREEIEKTVAEMSVAAGIIDCRKLYSVREWKKTSMKYFGIKEDR
jgi:DNA-binding Lrp family transcriptional regulator